MKSPLPSLIAAFPAIGKMQAGEAFGPLVLANRYDGIDLAGDACRFLVMDNLPQGTTNYDVFRMKTYSRGLRA